MAALAFHLMGAAPSQFGAQAGNFVSCPGRVGYFVQGLAGFAFFGLQVLLVALDGRRLIVQGGEKRNMAGQVVLDFGHPVAGLAIGPVSHRRRFTGGAFGCPGLVFGLLRRRLTVFGDFRRRFGLGQLFAGFLQALALLQPGLGGGGGGSGDGEPVPAPQRPVAADQTLTLGQVGGQTAGFVFAVDDADLRQPAFEGGGGLDEIAQRRGAAGQRRRAWERAQGPPVAGRRLVVGCDQVFAEGHGQRRLVTRIDGEGVDHRRPLPAVATFQDFR